MAKTKPHSVPSREHLPHLAEAAENVMNPVLPKMRPPSPVVTQQSLDEATDKIIREIRKLHDDLKQRQ
ncbi:hypothetical protein LCGC14_1024750 [marine sediment metagenome]|uniref:Uncharacterized protein n=1 Tax=marine sediment metagenome TaxID=412755 RepID=A0A0F9N0X2_9ZZZZ